MLELGQFVRRTSRIQQAAEHFGFQ